MKLFRPVGLKELELIEASDWRAFPPRLPDQPIFYPVLNFEYAEKIARDWNSVRPEPGNLGYVTAFGVEDSYVSKFKVETAGAASVHRELWVPTEELDEFNSYIIGHIQVVASYRNGKREEQ